MTKGLRLFGFIIIFLGFLTIKTEDHINEYTFQLDVYMESLKDDLNGNLENKIKSELELEIEKLEAQLENEIKETLSSELESSLRDSLRRELETSIKQSLRLELEDTIREELRLDLETSITEQLRTELESNIETLIAAETEQITNEILMNLDAGTITTVENMIVSMVESKKMGVLGVSNYQLNQGSYVETSTGSGVIYKQVGNDYYLVTNEHVTRDADKVSVVLNDLTYIDATLLGSDSRVDIAVIKFTSTQTLPVSSFQSTESIKLGQLAIALGNPLGYDFYGSVTMGVVSGFSRQIGVDLDDDGTADTTMTLLQHDATINPGNSGGPLFDLNGYIIGINNLKIVEQNVDNMGFAIPVDVVLNTITQIENQAS